MEEEAQGCSGRSYSYGLDQHGKPEKQRIRFQFEAKLLLPQQHHLPPKRYIHFYLLELFLSLTS